MFRLLLLAVFTSFAQSTKTINQSGNPIFPGWYADPDAAIFNNKYWVYPTYSAKYKEQVFLDAFSSDDLVKWKKHPHVLDTAAVKWANKAMWAPAIVQKDKKYYLFFGANDIQSDNEVGGIGVAVADKPEGPYKDHLGKPLVDKLHQQENKTRQIENKVNQLAAEQSIAPKPKVDAKFRATGFMIDASNNYLVTNAHVVREAKNQLVVENINGDQFFARRKDDGAFYQVFQFPNVAGELIGF